MAAAASRTADGLCEPVLSAKYGVCQAQQSIKGVFTDLGKGTRYGTKMMKTATWGKD